MRRPIPIVGGAYTDTARPFDLQDCVNFIPQPASNSHARSEGVLQGAPGLTLFCSIPNGPVRGLHDAEGLLFAVCGNEMYSISKSGVATSLGAIPGVGRVSMTHNQVAGGYEVVVVNGSDGYIYNTATETFSHITDPNFPGSISCDFIDQRVIHVEPNGSYWFASDLADALTYDPTNTFQAAISPDPILCVVVNHDEVWVFGKRTVQPFVDTGDSDILFQPQNGTAMQVGCAATNSVQIIDNSLFWLGNDGFIYGASTYVPERISTISVEQDIAGCNWSGAFAFTWVDRGHKVYYLTLPDGHTWGYDLNTQLWHRRESFGMERWRISQIVASNGQQIAGDIQNGNLYIVDWSNYTENGQPLIARRRTPYLHNNQNWTQMAAFELLMQPNVAAQGQDASVWLRYSDDYGTTWSNLRERPLIYGQRVNFTRLGRFRDRVFEIGISSPVQRDIIGAVAEFA